MADIRFLPTAPVADASLALGRPIRRLPDALTPVAPGMELAGRALPVRHYGSVDVFFDAMLAASPGDVLVIDNDARTDEGCIGDLTVLEAMHYRVAGFVVWGCHRDTAELRRLALPVFSIGRCPAGPQRLDRRDDPETVRVGDVVVRRGDVVVADDDGVLLVDEADAEAVLALAAGIVGREREQADAVRAGRTLHQQFEWDAYIRRRQSDPEWTLRRHLQAIGRAIEV